MHVYTVYPSNLIGLGYWYLQPMAHDPWLMAHGLSPMIYGLWKCRTHVCTHVHSACVEPNAQKIQPGCKPAEVGVIGIPFAQFHSWLRAGYLQYDTVNSIQTPQTPVVAHMP